MPHDPGHVWQADEVGPLLADLHAALRGFPGDLRKVDALAPLTEADVTNLVADAAVIRAELTGSSAEPTGTEPTGTETQRSLGTETQRSLDPVINRKTGRKSAFPFVEPKNGGMARADHATPRAVQAHENSQAVPLHGDAHPGNLLSTPTGPIWTDFEDAWRGPIDWDLACLELTGRLDGRAAVAGYPRPSAIRRYPSVARCPGAPRGPEPGTDADRIRPASTWFLDGRRLEGLVWSLVFRWRFPSAARAAETDRRIRHWRDHRS